MTRLPTLPSLALALLALCGCQHPPRVPTTWANAARGVVSPDTPEDEVRTPTAEWGPAEEREHDGLSSLDGEEDLGEVVVRLKDGVYVLEHDVVLAGAKSFVLEGEGPHKTRLQLDTDTLRSLSLEKLERVELRGLTVAGYTGGGIFVKDCPDVVVEDVHFAGSQVGLGLESSTASVGTAVFAGCQTGISAEDGEVKLRESAFLDCWVALGLKGGAIDVESCAFWSNHDVVSGTLDARSRIVGSAFGGRKQVLGWKGRPKLASDNLAPGRDLGDRLGRWTNRELRHPDDFPQGVLLPEDFDLPAVHLALERARKRGESDPPERLRELARAQAEAFAVLCQQALRARDLPTARRHARTALRYLGDTDLAEAPQPVIDIAELGRTP